MLIRKFRNAKFRIKIVLLFLIVFVGVYGITAAAYYTYSSRDIMNNYRKNSSDMVLQLDSVMSEKYGSWGARIDALCSNVSFVSPLKSYLNSFTRDCDAVLAGNVADSLAELATSDKLVSSVYLYTQKRLFSDYTQIPLEGVRYEDTEMYRHYVYYPSENMACFPAMENMLFRDNDLVIPIVYRRVVSGHKLFFIVNISQYALAQYLTESYQTFENIFIVNSENREIVNYDEMAVRLLEKLQYEDMEKGETYLDRLSIGDRQYLVTHMCMRGSGWKIYASTSMDSLTPNTHKLYWFMVWLLAAVVLIAGAVIVVFTRRLTGPLEKLAGIMNNSVSSNLKVRFDYEYQDEIGILGNSYNEMMDEICGLIAELNRHIEALKEEKENVKRIQRQKRKAELAVLEMQINPHFLYNTLNMITWQAVKQGAGEISVLSNALGKYFRISLSRGQEIITVREEEEHVRSYLEIQRIRYKDKLKYEIDLPEEIRELFTIKLVLQPLVENALYHGIKEKDGEGCIQIYGGRNESEAEGRYVEIIVEDDGLGIDEETLDHLNSRLEEGVVDSSSGYGIYNVNNRLKLYFGDKFGLKLESDVGEGTRSIIRFPLLKTKGQAEDVSVGNI